MDRNEKYYKHSCLLSLIPGCIRTCDGSTSIRDHFKFIELHIRPGLNLKIHAASVKVKIRQASVPTIAYEFDRLNIFTCIKTSRAGGCWSDSCSFYRKQCI